MSREDDIPLRSLGVDAFAAHLARMDALAAPLDVEDHLAWRSALCAAPTGPADHARCSHPSNRRRYDGCTCPCHRRGGAR